jgi:hypothetical protein
VGNRIVGKAGPFSVDQYFIHFSSCKKCRNLYNSVLKKEAACSSETSISTNKKIRYHNPEVQEDYNLKNISCIACEEFNPEIICSMFLRNVGFRLQEYTYNNPEDHKFKHIHI